MGRNNFLIEKSWGTMIRSLPDDKAGQLVKAMFDYEDGNDVSIDDPVLSAVFDMVREKMDTNSAHYAETCEKRRKAQEERWKKKDGSIQTNTNEYKCIEQGTDSNHNHNHISLSLKGDRGGMGEEEEKHAEEVNQVVDYLNSVLGTKYRAKSKQTARHIRARLSDGYSVDDCKRVVDIKFREWGEDEKMARYLRPETLFGGKFEAYLNQKEGVKLNGNGAPEGWTADYDKRWGYA